MEDENMNSKKSSKLAIVFAVLFIMSSALAYYFYSHSNGGKTPEQQQQDTQAEVRDIVQRVGRLILLPQGEDPTLATVIDPDKLKDQPFFANTSKGDKVLIYTKAKKAILYNPTADKIVEVAPISIGNPTESAPPAAQKETSATTTNKP